MSLSEVYAALSGLSATLEREQERAKHREEIIDRLHEENQLLRRGELQQMHDPVRNALYRLLDRVRQAQRNPPDAEGVPQVLDLIGAELVEAIERTGMEKYEVAVGDPYDRDRHRPLGPVPVTDKGLDGTVVEVCADGFARGEQIVRRAQVRVGKYQED
ncbi:nucleotide exchange factor GrpE [Actinocorallia longicatena]|uniref:Nucleotide exchange factor GrpE n=1 Tax=Actinocorallia longicatena TaxID=111803 RepID=A0ABP6QJB8_9ACTN